MSALIRTPECFPYTASFGVVMPPLGHSKCQGGFTLPGLIGGWRCACRCHSTPKPTGPVPYGTCDWGNCDECAYEVRWSDEHGWLPVCDKHAERPS